MYPVAPDGLQPRAKLMSVDVAGTVAARLRHEFNVKGLVHSSLKQLDISISGMTTEVYNVGPKNGRWDLI
jgi:hypothetical protein